MNNEYTLYGARMSLYTGKARAYLTYKQLAYKEVFSSLAVYKKIIIPSTGLRFIPVVKTPRNEFLQDTSHIIDVIEARHPERPVVPLSPKQKLVSYLFELWADEWLLIPAMHYRWNKNNFPFIYQEFGRIVAPKMPAFVRTFLGKKVAAKFKGFVPILGINESTIAAIELWYEKEVLVHLNQHFAKHRYLLGDAPTLGDFALMGPLYAHLYRDPAPGQIMLKIAPHVVSWIERMNNPPESVGALLSDDQIPETLLPLLQNMFKDQWPVLHSTVSALENWASSQPKQSMVPRSLGKHDFKIGDVMGQRAILSFNQWKMQRVLDCYQSFSADEKQQCEALLKQVDGLPAMSQVITTKVARINNILQLA